MSRLQSVIFRVQLFGKDDVPLGQTPNIHAIARSFLEHALGTSLEPEEVALVLYDVPAAADEAGPGLRDRSAGWGYLDLFALKKGALVYRHPHPVGEVMAIGLPRWIERESPGLEVSAFAVYPEDEGPPAPPIHEAAGPTSTKRAAPTFRLKRLEDPPPPLRSRASLGITAADSVRMPEPPVRVYLRSDVHRALKLDRPFSRDVEEGGFFLGQVFRDEDAPERYLVEIVEAVAAQHTGASLLHLTFTGETFASLTERVRASEGALRLVGWYHTHLFAATESFGLSSIDDRLHHTTFKLPWQVAGLVNIDVSGGKERRALRFYFGRDRRMVRCPVEVLG